MTMLSERLVPLARIYSRVAISFEIWLWPWLWLVEHRCPHNDEQQLLAHFGPITFRLRWDFRRDND